MQNKQEDKLYGNSLLKVIQILDFLQTQDKPQSWMDIFNSLNVSKGTLSKVLKTMQILDLVFYDEHQKHYILGSRLISYGQKALNNLNLEQMLQPTLNAIYSEIEETMHLGVKQNNKVVYIAKKEAKSAVALRSRIGDNVALYSSAMGKALLCEESIEKIDDYLMQNKLIALTPKTIIDNQKFKEELVTIKKQGFAVDDEENELGIRCFAIAIKKFDFIYGALSISVPIYRLNQEKEELIIKRLLELKKQIHNS